MYPNRYRLMPASLRAMFPLLFVWLSCVSVASCAAIKCICFSLRLYQMYPLPIVPLSDVSATRSAAIRCTVSATSCDFLFFRIFLFLTFNFNYFILHCFICLPTDSIVVRGCWDWTQECRDFGIGTQNRYITTRLDLIHRGYLLGGRRGVCWHMERV
jgi:hypothetical protein